MPLRRSRAAASRSCRPNSRIGRLSDGCRLLTGAAVWATVVLSLEKATRTFCAAKVGPEEAQDAAQYAHESAGKDQYKKQQTPVFPEEYEGLLAYTSVQAPPGGVEPPFSD